MSRYRKVDVRIWSDAKFRALSDDAKMLWLHLLTSPSMLAIPGVIVSGPAAIAESLEWLPERFEEPFEELLRNGLVYGDLPGRVIWLPKAIKRNPPANPNAVKAWAKCWDEVPDSALKIEIWRALKPFAERFTEQFAELFPEPIAEPFTERIGEQEQIQSRSREGEGTVPVSLSGSGSTAPPPAVGERGRVAESLWSEYAEHRERLRKAIAPGSLATPMSPGSSRCVLDLLRDGVTEAEIRNAIANGAAEAEHKRSLRWFEKGNLFRRETVSRIGGLSLEDYRREYLGGAKGGSLPGGFKRRAELTSGDPDRVLEEFSFD